MGKKDKEHRKKIQVRNQKLKAADIAMQKLFQESMKRKLAKRNGLQLGVHSSFVCEEHTYPTSFSLIKINFYDNKECNYTL